MDHILQQHGDTIVTHTLSYNGYNVHLTDDLLMWFILFYKYKGDEK